jgi:ElaB/YqjD/DUF883 family membrane-anchored ribosome-binding protein
LAIIHSNEDKLLAANITINLRKKLRTENGRLTEEEIKTRLADRIKKAIMSHIHVYIEKNESYLRPTTDLKTYSERALHSFIIFEETIALRTKSTDDLCKEAYIACKPLIIERENNPNRPFPMSLIAYSKYIERAAKTKYEEIKNSDEKLTRKLQYFLFWVKMHIQYYYDYELAINSDTERSRHRERMSDLRTHIDALFSACFDETSNHEEINIPFPKLSTEERTILGSIKRDLKDVLKETFGKKYLDDLEHCQSSADTKKLFKALIALREAKYNFINNKNPITFLEKEKSDLNYQKTLSEISNNSKNGNNIDTMISYVDKAIETVQSSHAVIDAKLPLSKQHKIGQIGKNRERLKKFRDSYQKDTLAKKELEYESAKRALECQLAKKSLEYRLAKRQHSNTFNPDEKNTIILMLKLIISELALKETLYEGRKNTNRSFYYHGFFSRSTKHGLCITNKLAAATELKKYVTDLEQAIQSSAALPANPLSLVENPEQKTLNGIRKKIECVLKKINKKETIILILKAIKNELILKETLYEGRKNTNRSFYYHGFFSRSPKHGLCITDKLSAATELKKYVTDLEQAIQSSAALPANPLSLVENPEQKTLNGIRKKIEDVLKKITDYNQSISDTAPSSLTI